MSTLIAIALIQAIVYGAIAWLSSAFAYGTDEQSRPILSVLLLFTASFVLYVVALRVAVRYPPNWRLGWTIVAPAIIFRCILIPSEPIQETDIYRYLWDGAASAYGLNPYRFAPAQIAAAAAEADLSDDFRQLVYLRDSSPPMAVVLRRIHYAELTTIYPPISQAVFAVGDWLTPDHTSVYGRVIILKIVLLAFDVGTMAFVWLLLKATSKHVGWAVAYAWCPVVIKEFANSGHLDAIAVFFTTAAVYCVTRSIAGESKNIRTGLLSAGAVLLALAIGAKLYAIVLIPVLCAAIAARSRVLNAVLFASVAVFSSVGCLAPMLLTTPASMNTPPLLPQHTSETATGSNSGVGESTALIPTSGLKAFVSRWEMNDFLFMLLLENLRPVAPDPQVPRVWFAITPNTWREAVVLPIAKALGTDQATAAFLLTRVVTSCVFLVTAVALAWRVYRRANATALAEASFLTLAWFWLLSPTQNPWYWIWALPLLPFARSRAWYAMSGLVMLYYVRFWLRYQFPEGPTCGLDYNGAQFFDYVVTWLEYAPWIAWLGIAFTLRRQRANNNRPFGQESVGGFTDATNESAYYGD